MECYFHFESNLRECPSLSASENGVRRLHGLPHEPRPPRRHGQEHPQPGRAGPQADALQAAPHHQHQVWIDEPECSCFSLTVTVIGDKPVPTPTPENPQTSIATVLRPNPHETEFVFLHQSYLPIPKRRVLPR